MVILENVNSQSSFSNGRSQQMSVWIVFCVTMYGHISSAEKTVSKKTNTEQYITPLICSYIFFYGKNLH